MSESHGGQIDTVMHEERLFPPSVEFSSQARISSIEQYEQIWDEAKQDPAAFWGRLAQQDPHWFEPFAEILQWNEPLAKWFVGGKTNASYNCLDKHLDGPTADKRALIWEGEPGEQRTLTYRQLHAEVCKFANALKSLGIQPGDVVSIYMPMVPELVIAMLACARIGVFIR